MAKYRIAWMPGDGVGNDVMEAARIVLDRMKFDAEYVPCDIGWEFWCKEGNAFNNGFVVFECPELVTHLRAVLTDRMPTTVGPEITIDYAKSILSVDGKSFSFPPLSPAAQELIVAGGARKSRIQSASRKIVCGLMRAKPTGISDPGYSTAAPELVAICDHILGALAYDAA